MQLKVPSKFKKFVDRLKKRWNSLSKRNQIIALCAATGILCGIAGAAVIFWPEPTTMVVTPAPLKIVEVPKPTTEASDLTGLNVPIGTNKRPVTAVMIENSPDARPQYGLRDAGVVFEAVAEGGITRFLALFQDTMPGYVGPVRSARPYYVRWMLGFDANYAHAGGSAKALAMIRELNVRDIDHGANGSRFDRVSSRYAPHNLYTSIERLLAAGKERGYGDSDYTGFLRKEEKKLEKPKAKTISIEISIPLYNVSYKYDAKNNYYLRSLAGRAHTDEKSGKQIKPKVVMVLITDKSQSGIYSVYRTSGVGNVIVFQDGDVTKGTWEKAGDKKPLIFKDSKGRDLKLNPGQTWITAVGNADSVSYKP